jgi:hypothetical protein
MYPFNRRQFFQRTAAASVATLAAHRAQEGACAEQQHLKGIPYRTIYSNDTTHILSCKIPWRDRNDELTDEHLARSITEAAAIDAHFLQPGLGWIPWWPSQIYSPQDHYVEFLQKEHGYRKPNKIGRYLLDGGDMLRTLVTTCKQINVAPFLSFRLNDGHHVRKLREARKSGRPSDGMSRHYWENYERFRIGSDLTNWDDGVFDWSIPEVRDHKFALIEEACANYDLAGIELDFLRHWVRFGARTGIEERREITSSFVRRVREMLDRTSQSRGLPHRWLCVRVPANADVRPEQGIDLAELTSAGVDMVNLSYSYFTWQDDSVRRAVQEVNDARVAIYAEMTHTTMTGKATSGSGSQPFLRTTDHQFYSTALLAYEQGATGVSLFNFPYYRYHVTDAIGPFHEPPFHVLPKLKDTEQLKQQPQWYFLSSGRKDSVLGERRLPTIVSPNTPTTLPIEIAGPQRNADGVLRLRSDESIADREIAVLFNGRPLAPIAYVEKPLDHPYHDTWLGSADEHVCYALPTAALSLGINQITVTLNRGISMHIIYVDVILP